MAPFPFPAPPDVRIGRGHSDRVHVRFTAGAGRPPHAEFAEDVAPAKDARAAPATLAAPSLRGALATKQSRGGGTCGARGPQTQCCGPWIDSIARSQRRDWRRFVRQDRPEADRSCKVRIEVAPLRVHCLDQGHLLGARAALELLLARDRFIHAFTGLVEQPAACIDSGA